MPLVGAVGDGLGLAVFGAVVQPADVDPLRAARMQALLRALVHLQVVMADDGRGRVDEAVVHEGALQQQIRRADQAEGPALHQRLVGGQRLEQAQRLDRPLHHDVGEVRCCAAPRRGCRARSSP